ncbi:MAG TPA: M50 family metallopeptidase [Verrucomicrobiae bacterium]|nr:M50 family metallopeptidase [Verrucomicrobiae bacterium]
MAKWCKLIVAILLLPLCAGAGEALWNVLRASGRADTIWVAALSGAACWVVIYLLMPKPMWLYVFGHELTHALWTWLMGGRVKKFRASSKGGHVIVTKNNFIIALAPYFFPVYAVLLVVAYWAGNFLWNLRPYAVWFHLVLGAAYGFHVTLTWHILKSTQSDITEQGYLFSAVIIFLGNVCVLLVAVPLLGGQVKPWTGLEWWISLTWDMVKRVQSFW